jgi:serine/threonine-protein kinase HipA
MRRTIQVFIGETPVHVGVIHFDSQGARESAAFEYASEWLASRDAFALAPVLRLVAGPQFHKRTRDGSVFHINAATMLGVDTTTPSEHSYTEIVDAIRAHGSSAQADISELFRRIAFSILITNVDDHLLNHGFLHVDHGVWRLAPAFDINPFPDRARELKTWISEETGPVASIEALMSIAPYFRLDAEQARRVVQDVEASVAR